MSYDHGYALEVCLRCRGTGGSVSIGLVFDASRADFACAYFRIDGVVCHAVQNVNKFRTWGYLVRVDDPAVRLAVNADGCERNLHGSGNEFVRSVNVDSSSGGYVCIQMLSYLVRQGPCSLRVCPGGFSFVCKMSRANNRLRLSSVSSVDSLLAY